MSSLFLFFVLSIFISSALGAPLDNVAFLLEERAAPIPINRISLQSLTYSGNGCPDGSAQSVLSDDKGALTVIFDQFIASAGPAVALTENRKSCILTVQLNMPPGVTFTIFKLDTRGHASLDSGTSGRLDVGYGFSNDNSRRGKFHLDFSAPSDTDYKLTRALPAHQRVWKSCDSMPHLLIDQAIQVVQTDRTAAGALTVDTSDLKVAHVFKLQYKRC